MCAEVQEALKLSLHLEWVFWVIIEQSRLDILAGVPGQVLMSIGRAAMFDDFTKTLSGVRMCQYFVIHTTLLDRVRHSLSCFLFLCTQLIVV